jgi:hypothetical protein
MNGKGDERRPMTVQYNLFENNWDKAFGKKEPQPLREVSYDGMWQHSCTVEMSVVWIGKNETCDYCGAWEEDGI